MPDVNKANRQVCDVDIRILSTMTPFLFFDTANTTTAGITAENVYAMAKGARRITFQDPLTGTMTIEAQVFPFRFYALLTDGTITSTTATAEHAVVKCTTGGELPLNVTGGTVKTGTVFVYPKGSFGDESAKIEGTFATNAFTATTAADITANAEYEVGFIVNRESGVNHITFSNKNLPKDYFITMSTLYKDENGTFVPYRITAYKASIQRNIEFSWTSEGDPGSVTLTFDLAEDADGNVMSMDEITSDITINAT